MGGQFQHSGPGHVPNRCQYLDHITLNEITREATPMSHRIVNSNGALNYKLITQHNL